MLHQPVCALRTSDKRLHSGVPEEEFGRMIFEKKIPWGTVLKFCQHHMRGEAWRRNVGWPVYIRLSLQLSLTLVCMTCQKNFMIYMGFQTQVCPRKMMWRCDEIFTFVPSARKIVTFLEVQPIADRVALNFEIISEKIQFSTKRTRILMEFIIYYLVLIVNPMDRILVRWKSIKNNLEIQRHPICNWLS